MLHSLLTRLDKIRPFSTASAHCDIPCKIYDPIQAQIAALTAIRMIDLIQEIQSKGVPDIKDQTQLIRLVNEKEIHGAQIKEAIRVIWGDYFKQPQFEQVPEVHTLVHNIMLQASKVKQGVDRDEALTLLDLVNQFADAFWLTKGVNTYKATCPYPPAETVVYPSLASDA